MKRFILFISITLILLVSSCATTAVNVSNSLGNWYNPVYDLSSYPDECFLQEGEEPIIYKSNNLYSDILTINKSYLLVPASSGWNGPEISESTFVEGIKKFCIENRFIGAIYSIEYTNTKNGTYNTTHYYTSSDYNYSPYGGYYTTTTTPYTKTHSYSVDRYDYSVYFIIRMSAEQILNNYSIGIWVSDLSDSDRQAIKRNYGVVVNTVFNESNAYKANIVEGDVIIKMNGNDINNTQDYYDALSQVEEGKIIRLELFRDGKIEKVSYKFTTEISQAENEQDTNKEESSNSQT